MVPAAPAGAPVGADAGADGRRVPRPMGAEAGEGGAPTGTDLPVVRSTSFRPRPHVAQNRSSSSKGCPHPVQ